jgi:AraC-like DNA-binding protein
MALLIEELFYALNLENVENAREMKEINPILSGALKYINDNLFTLKGISEVTDALFVTESYLHRLFKSELHKSPKKYINDKRLLAAQSLIQMGEKPTEIYERCGFSDYTSFYRNYKEHFGYSPSKESDFGYEAFGDTH